MQITRREFLSMIAAAGAASVLPSRSYGMDVLGGRRDFEFLVIGDSLVWGQGLEEEQKFYHITKRWLEETFLAGRTGVNLRVHAHSGSTIVLSEEEAKALISAEIDEKENLHPEINVSFPTISSQLDKARLTYKDPASVDLILLSGSVPEVGIARILNPFQSDEKLRDDIKLYCHRHMSELLKKTHDAFPNALIAVVGYYPIITKHTPMKRVVKDILELYNWPNWIKPLMNNPLNRILWRRFRRKMIKRSKIWVTDSSAELKKAIDELNQYTKRDDAVFVLPPFTEQNAYGARETYLWRLAKRGQAADPMKDVRLEECRPALDALRSETGLKYRTRVCELASIGHPNVQGSAAIAEAVKDALSPLIQEKVSNL